MESLSQIILDCFDFIDIKHIQALGKLFTTNRNSYLYDTGTGKVFSLSENEFIIMSYLFGKDIDIEHLNVSYKEIKEFADKIKQENLFIYHENKKFLECTDEFLYEKVDTGISQVVFELTQNCNLRCGYCIYQSQNNEFRNFNNENMSWLTAKKTLDYVAQHTGDKIAISFYGGEPLLNFELIQKIVQYSLEVLADKKVVFSLTTNLVLLTKEIAEYFASIPNFGIVGSLDGPQEVHDAKRKDYVGNGTFHLAITGLKNMVDAYKKRNIDVKEQLSLSMVIDRPYGRDKFNVINEFFNQLNWLDPMVSKNVTYASYSVEQEIENSKVETMLNPEDSDVILWALDNNTECNFCTQSLKNLLLPIHRRRISNNSLEKMKNNACCTPGSRKIYVTTDGKFKLCERIGTSPEIGDVDHGINFTNLKKFFIEDYQKNSIDECSKCWASNLCTVCYAQCYDENGINMDVKLRKCRDCKSLVEESLIHYHRLMEETPHFIEKLNEIQIEY